MIILVSAVRLGGPLASLETQGASITDEEYHWFLYDGNAHVGQVFDATEHARRARLSHFRVT